VLWFSAHIRTARENLDLTNELAEDVTAQENLGVRGSYFADCAALNRIADANAKFGSTHFEVRPFDWEGSMRFEMGLSLDSRA
jgi:hypothetical protein